MQKEGMAHRTERKEMADIDGVGEVFPDGLNVKMQDGNVGIIAEVNSITVPDLVGVADIGIANVDIGDIAGIRAETILGIHTVGKGIPVLPVDIEKTVLQGLLLHGIVLVVLPTNAVLIGEGN